MANEWRELSEWIIRSLEEHNDDLKTLRDKVTKLEVRIAVLATVISIIVNLGILIIRELIK